MKISIIVPVYNAEKTIEYCIDSIIAQKTKFEIELILVEDYSTDRSYEICLALDKKYTEIKLYRTNGKGVSAARNTGLSHSTGDIVGFCDSDDIYEKDVFEKVRLFFENKDIDIVIGGFYYSKKDSLNTVVQETHSHNRQRNVEGHLLYNMILNDGRILGSVCNKFYRAESIRNFSFLTELEYCEDLVFNAKLVEKNNLKAVIVGYPIYHYIINEESATNNRDEFIGDMMETVSNLFVSVCVGIIAIMPFVFPVMVNQQYGNAYYQIPILLIAVIFQILVGLYSAIYIALKKSSTIARTTIAGAIINVLVNLALIRFIGLYAASISTLVSYASTALYRRIDIRKYIKIKVNVKNILLNSVAVVFVTLSYYFNITILNVAALVIACIYAVGINWKLIKMFFAEIRKYKKEGN